MAASSESGTSSQATESAPSSSQASGEESQSAELPLSGEHFVIATEAECPGFETIDENGIIVGFDADLMKELSNRLGFTYEYSDMAFDGLVGSLTSGRCDMICSAMSATEEREEVVDFTNGYFSEVICLVSGKDSGILSLDQLEGKSLGASAGTMFQPLAESLAEKYNGKAQIYDGSVGAISIVGTSQLDVMVENSTYAENYAEPRDLTVAILPYDVLDPVYCTPYAIAFPDGSEYPPIFNEALAEMQEDGTIDQLVEKWMGSYFKECLEIANTECPDGKYPEGIDLTTFSPKSYSGTSAAATAV